MLNEKRIVVESWLNLLDRATLGVFLWRLEDFAEFTKNVGASG